VRLVLALSGVSAEIAYETAERWSRVEAVSMFAVGTELVAASGLGWTTQLSELGRPLLWDTNLATGDPEQVASLLDRWVRSGPFSCLTVTKRDLVAVARWSIECRTAGRSAPSVVASLLPGYIEMLDEAELRAEVSSIKALGIADVKIPAAYISRVSGLYPDCRIWLDQSWEDSLGAPITGAPPQVDVLILSQESQLWPARP
jgi:hypothetical protein